MPRAVPRALLGQVGEVKVSLVTNQRGASKGYAYIELANEVSVCVAGRLPPSPPPQSPPVLPLGVARCWGLFFVFAPDTSLRSTFGLQSLVEPALQLNRKELKARKRPAFLCYTRPPCHSLRSSRLCLVGRPCTTGGRT